MATSWMEHDSVGYSARCRVVLGDAGVPAVSNLDTNPNGAKGMDAQLLRTGLPQAPRVLFLNMRCKFSQAAYVLSKVLTSDSGPSFRSSSLARSDQ